MMGSEEGLDWDELLLSFADERLRAEVNQVKRLRNVQSLLTEIAKEDNKIQFLEAVPWRAIFNSGSGSSSNTPSYLSSDAAEAATTVKKEVEKAAAAVDLAIKAAETARDEARNRYEEQKNEMLTTTSPKQKKEELPAGFGLALPAP